MTALTQSRPARASAVTDDQLDRYCAPRRVDITEGATLTQLMEKALPDPVLRHHAVILMEGEVVPRESWARIRPKAKTQVQIGLKPGGQTGKKILKSILIIAVVVVATWIAGPNFGAAGASYLFGSQTAAAVAAAAFATVANLAINALLPPPTYSGKAARSEFDPTYSLQGTRNQRRPRQTVEVVWGHHRYTPSLMSEQYSQPIGDDIFLNFVVCVGIGNYEVTDWQIGETPLSAFDGVTQQDCLTIGAPEQTLIPGDFTQDGLSVALSTGWQERRTAADVSDIEVFLSFPRGLGTRDDEGNPQSVTVGIEVEYREVNSGGAVGSWVSAAAGNGAVADSGLQGGGFVERAEYWAAYDSLNNYSSTFSDAGTYGLGSTYSRSDTKPFARRIRFAVPPGRQYDVRVRRTTPRDTDVSVANDVNWASLNSFSQNSLTPDPRFATVAFRIKASEELSGVISNLNGLVKKIIPSFGGNPATFDPALADAADWVGNDTTSRNPADIILDINRGPHTDNPLPDSEIYWPDFAQFWIWCKNNDFTFDLPLTQDMSRTELEEMVAAAGRARIFRGTDGKKHIAIDRPRTEGAKQLITAKNVRNFVAVRSFSAPVHALRIPFTNAEDNYRDDEMFVYREGYGPVADPANNILAATLFNEFSLPGRVVPDNVWKEGKYTLNSATMLTTNVTFEMDWEGKSLTLGDFVRVQHPVLNEVSVSANITDVSGNQIQLDKPVEFGAGLNYVMRYRKIIDNGDGTGTISAEGIVALQNPGDIRDVVTLAEALPPGVMLEEGDLATVGIEGEETFEGLIKNIEPSGPKQMNIELVAYLPERLTLPPPPPRNVVTPENWLRPPTPLLIGAETTPDHITVSFDLPGGYARGVSGFRTRYWQKTSPDPLPVIGPRLDAEDRSYTLPAGTPGTLYDVEIRSEDFDGRVSNPLRVENLSASSAVPAPKNPVITPRLETNADGVKFPVIDVAVDPVDPVLIETLLIERRLAGSPAWTATTTAPADNPVKTLTGLLPGVNIDLRLSWRDVRGAVTAFADKVVIEDIAVPADFVSGDTANVGGTPSSQVLSDISNRITTQQSQLELAAATNNLNDAIAAGDQAEADARALVETDVNALKTSVYDPSTGLNQKASIASVNQLGDVVDGKASATAVTQLLAASSAAGVVDFQPGLPGFTGNVFTFNPYTDPPLLYEWVYSTDLDFPSAKLTPRSSSTVVRRLTTFGAKVVTEGVRYRTRLTFVITGDAGVGPTDFALVFRVRSYQADGTYLSQVAGFAIERGNYDEIQTYEREYIFPAGTTNVKSTVENVSGIAANCLIYIKELSIEDIEDIASLDSRAEVLEAKTVTSDAERAANAQAIQVVETEINDPATGLNTKASNDRVATVESDVAGKASASDLNALNAIVTHPDTGLATRASADDLVLVENEIGDPITGLGAKASALALRRLQVSSAAAGELAFKEGLPGYAGNQFTQDPEDENPALFEWEYSAERGFPSAKLTGFPSAAVRSFAPLQGLIAEKDAKYEATVVFQIENTSGISSADQVAVLRIRDYKADGAYRSARAGIGIDRGVQGSIQTVTLPYTALSTDIMLKPTFENDAGLNTTARIYVKSLVLRKLDARLLVVEDVAFDAAAQIGRSNFSVEASLSDANTARLSVGAFKENGTEFNRVIVESDFFGFRAANGKGFSATESGVYSDLPYISESADGESWVVTGNGFGADGDLMRWEGPNLGTPDACTKQNGQFAFTTTRELWQFGSQLGTTAIETYDSRASDGVVTTTGIGANGNVKSVTGSARITSSRNYYSSAYPVGTTTFAAGNATVTTERRATGGTWVGPSPQSNSGTVTRTVHPFTNSSGDNYVQETFEATATKAADFGTVSGSTYEVRATGTTTLPAGYVAEDVKISIATNEPG